MAFLKDFSKTLSSVAQTTATKTKELAGTAKINLAIAAEEREINKHFTALGEWYYETNNANPDPAVAETFAAIEACYAKIEQLKATDAASSPQNAEAEPETVVEIEITCPSCGESTTGAFCSACGKKLEDE